MFELFGSKPYEDPQLGELHKSGGHWKGSIVLPPGAFRLSFAGDRNAPHASVVSH